MTLENYINAYEIINSDNQVLAIEFFGGEPLLNFSVIKKFVNMYICEGKN